jgi:hypothetical protein
VQHATCSANKHINCQRNTHRAEPRMLWTARNEGRRRGMRCAFDMLQHGATCCNTVAAWTRLDIRPPERAQAGLVSGGTGCHSSSNASIRLNRPTISALTRASSSLASSVCAFACRQRTCPH